MRKRRFTEHMGLNVSILELETVKQHAKTQRITVSEYLRRAAVQPLMAQQESEAHGHLSPIAHE